MKKKQFAVLGLGRFGQAVARTLSQLGHEVLAVDQSMEHVEAIAPLVTHAVAADVTDEAAVGALGLHNYDCVIVSIAQDTSASFMAVMLSVEAGANCVIAKASDTLHAKMLYKIGAQKVIFPERDSGVRLAHNLSAANILDSFDFSSDYSIAEIEMPQRWADKTLRELNVRASHGMNVVAVKRGEHVSMVPDADTPLSKDDILIILAEKSKLAKLDER